MAKLDAAYADQMTPEEIAAYEAEDETAAEAAVAALAERGTPEGADDEAPGDPPEPEAEPEAEAEAEPEPEPEPEPAPEPAPKAAPTIDVEGAQKAIEAAKKERRALRDQYDDGDLTDEEYDAALETLDEKAADARAAIKLAEHQAEQENQTWQQAGEAYLKEYPDLGKPELAAAMNLAIQDLSRLPSLANLSDAEFLNRVHRKMLADSVYTGLEVPALKGEGMKGKTSHTPPPPKGDPDLGRTPKTLGGTPSSDVQEMGGGRFAYMEKLAETDPAKHEEEYLRMSHEDREAYLRAGG